MNSVAPTALELFLRAGLLGLLALLASALLRCAPAAWRHTLWLGVIGVLAVLPATIALPATFVVPGVTRPGLPAIPAPPSTTAAPIDFDDRLITNSPAPTVPNAAATSEVAPADAGAASPPSPMRWTTLALIVWALGAMVSLLRIGFDLFAIHRLRRSAVPFPVDDAIDNSPIVALAPIAIHPSVRVPMACGLIKPLIVLPPDASSWPALRLRAALRHEAAHVARRDALVQTVARAIVALWWFHPIAHLALARLLHEAERACDESVIASGIAPTEYASALLEVAQMLTNARKSRRPLPGAPALLRSASLENRIRHALSSRPNARRQSHLAALVAALPLVAVALIRPAASAQDTPKPAPTPRSVRIIDQSAIDADHASKARKKAEAVRREDLRRVQAQVDAARRQQEAARIAAQRARSRSASQTSALERQLVEQRMQLADQQARIAALEAQLRAQRGESQRPKPAFAVDRNMLSQIDRLLDQSASLRDQVQSLEKRMVDLQLELTAAKGTEAAERQQNEAARARQQAGVEAVTPPAPIRVDTINAQIVTLHQIIDQKTRERAMIDAQLRALRNRIPR